MLCPPTRFICPAVPGRKKTGRPCEGGGVRARAAFEEFFIVRALVYHWAVKLIVKLAAEEEREKHLFLYWNSIPFSSKASFLNFRFRILLKWLDKLAHWN
jgi:hypothetical protein